MAGPQHYRRRCRPPPHSPPPGKTLIKYNTTDPGFRQYTNLTELDDAFEPNVVAFKGAMEAVGVTVTVTNTIRPAVKALVMHVASCLAVGCTSTAPQQCGTATCPLDSRTKRLTPKLDQQILARAKAARSATKNAWTEDDYAEAVAYLKTRTFLVSGPRAGAGGGGRCQAQSARGTGGAGGGAYRGLAAAMKHSLRREGM